MDGCFYKGKRVLVTGHTGFKGTWLTMILNALGAEVVGYSDGELLGESLHKIVRPQTYATVWGDICDLDLLKETITKYRIQYVIHMAAQTIVQIGMHQPYETFRVNAMGGAAVLEAVNQCSSVTGLLFATTDKVYRNDGRPVPFSENHPLWATSPYAASKCCAELMVQTYYETCWKNRTIGVAVVRAGNVIGGGDFAPYRIIPDCVRSWRKGEPIALRNPEAVRPYQHVLDALFAYLRILQGMCTDRSQFSAYNVGLDWKENCTTKKLMELFFDSLNAAPSAQLCDREKKFTEDLHLVLNSEKLWTDLKYTPLWDLRQAIDKTAEWYRVWAQGGNVHQCCLEQIEAHMADKGVYYGE